MTDTNEMKELREEESMHKEEGIAEDDHIKEEPPPAPAMTPLPYKKVFIGAMIWFIDWFNGSSLATFVGFMVLDFGMATTKAEVGYYSGFISSTYYFSQFLSSFWWGKISDKVGRRPILIIGLLGSLISTVAFGFSTSFGFAIAARSLNGLLNSNSGIVKTYVAEITDSTNQARAFSYLSLFGGLGMVVGPMVGGYCAQPVQKYPSLFPPGSLLDKFPYLLPSLVSAFLNIILLILAFVYLTETRKPTYVNLKQSEDDEAKDDVNTERKIGTSISLAENGKENETEKEMEDFSSSDKETAVLITDEEGESESIDDTESLGNGGNLGTISQPNQSALRKWLSERFQKLGMLKDRNVLLSCGLYAFYGFTSSTYGEVLPLFALLPISLGGMNFNTDQIGNLATIAGATIILFNMLFYHKIVHKFGLIRTFQIGTAGLVVLHLMIAEVPRWTLQGNSTENTFIVPHFDFWMLMIFVSCLFWCGRQMQLTSLMQLISNSVTPRDMGAVNGLAQSIVALTRMFAPTFGSTVLAWSVSVNAYWFLTSRFVFIILGILSFVMVLTTRLLDKALNKPKLWDG